MEMKDPTLQVAVNRITRTMRIGDSLYITVEDSEHGPREPYFWGRLELREMVIRRDAQTIGELLVALMTKEGGVK